MNVPGEASSVITCLDGHQMARKGRAGAALTIAAVGSFFAGCVSTVLVAALGVPLTSIALLFGPAEYFSLMLLGLIFAVVLAKGSVLKSIAMVLTGLLLSMVGSDLETGAGRMTFDIAELSDGIGFTNVAMGLFGFAEIIRNLEMSQESRDIVKGKIKGLMPTRQDLIRLPVRLLAAPFSVLSWEFCPAAAQWWRHSPPIPSRSASRSIRSGSDAARSGAWPRQKAPTTPRRRPHSFRCSRSASAQRGHGIDGRRNDNSWHRARPASDDQAA